MSAMTQFANLYLARKELEDHLEAVMAELKEVEADVLAQFADMGVPELIATSSTGCKVRLKLDRKLWASAKDAEAAAPLLLKYYDLDLAKVTIHGGSLSAHIRSTYDPNGDTAPEDVVAAMPEELRALITVSEKIQIMAYPSTKKHK